MGIDKRTLRELELAYQAQKQQILASTSVVKKETTEEREARVESYKKDYASFVNYYFPSYAYAPVADFQIKAAKEVLKRKKGYNIIEWFRGAAKSTHFTFFFPLYLTLFDEIRYCIIMCETLERSMGFLTRLQAHFESNQRWIADFGNEKNYGNWADEAFITNSGIRFESSSLDKGIRGNIHHDWRPDYVAADDLDNLKTCKNPSLVAFNAERLLRDVLPAMDARRHRYIHINNEIAKNTILGYVKKLDGVYHSRVPLTNPKTGKSNWEGNVELNVEEIKKRYKNKQGLYLTEYELTPTFEGKIFKEEYFLYESVKKSEWKNFHSIVAYCDLSYKATKTADYKACAIIGKLGRKFYLLDAFDRQCTMGLIINWLFDRYKLFKEKGVELRIIVEGNFIQKEFHERSFQEYEIKHGMILPKTWDTSRKDNKFNRIASLEGIFTDGLFIVAENIKDNDDFLTMKDQFLLFEEGSNAPDDGPDAVHGGLSKLNVRATKNEETSIVLGTHHFEKGF